MDFAFIAHKRKSDGVRQSLEAHLLETGNIAGELSAKIGLPDLGMVLGLLHDFGKYSCEFQRYIKSATGDMNQDDEEYVDSALLKGKIDHSTAGAQYVYQKLRNMGAQGQGELLGQMLAVCIASHHSGLIDTLSVDFSKGDVFKTRIGKDVTKSHLIECQESVNKVIRDKAKALLTPDLAKPFMALIKKIGRSPQQAFDLVPSFQFGMLTRFLFSCLIDADRLNSAEFEEPERLVERQKKEKFPNWDVAIDRLETLLSGLELKNPIDQIRRDISEQCRVRAGQVPGVYSLTVPTGGGKTYASLRYALHHAQKNNLERIFYIIPYTSIIEQNAKVMRDAIERAGDDFPWILEHHSNLEPEQQTWHSKLVGENWDAPIVITSMVQFLETLFSGGTRSVRRLHQFANSVLVFDEAQTLPINCVHLFCNTLNFFTDHAKTSVLLCTATQPLLNNLDDSEKGQLNIAAGSELIPNLSELFKALHRVDVQNLCKAGGWSESEISKFALERFNETGSCLLIVNTKEWALKLYGLCAEHVPKEAIFHLSTNQCPAHRKVLLDIVRARLDPDNPKPVLCISTQLIEAGVDVDFASVIRFIAGLDSVAQAAGRCNRNGRLNTANVFVVNPDKENTKWLQDIEVGKEKAERVLGEFFDDVLAPDAIQRYFQYYFFDRKSQMSYPCKDSQGNPNTLLNLLANQQQNPNSCHASRKQNNKLPNLQQAFMEAGKIFKAIDAPTHALIVQYGEGKDIVTGLCAVAKEFDPARYYKLLRRAQKYSVNVFPNVWEKLKRVEAIEEIQGEGIYYLREEFYSKEFGMSTDQVSALASNII